MTRLAALGDSFSAGTDADPEATVWVRRVAAHLAAQGRLTSLDVHARHGAMSDDVVMEQLPALLGAVADMVTITFGANDVLRNPAPDLDRFEGNLDLVLERTTGLPRTRVLTATYPDFSPFLPYRPLSKARVVDGMADVNERIRRLSSRYGTLCVDVERHLEPESASFADDGLHLSAAGHRRVASLVLAALGETPEAPLQETLLTQWW